MDRLNFFRSKHFRWVFEALLTAAGAYLFYRLVRSFGWSELSSVLRSVGAWWPALLLYYPFMSFWDVLAWRSLFPRVEAAKLRLGRLFWIRLAGEAVNNVTPMVDVGGEPLKVRLLVKNFGVSKPAATASVIVARTSILVSEALFLLVGAALAGVVWPMGDSLRLEIAIGIAAIAALSVAILWVQRSGWLARVSPEIRPFYAEERKNFWKAVSFDGMGWALGSVEMYWMCRLVGAPVSWLESFLLESMLQLIRTTTFFIPWNLGTQEGGLVFLMSLGGHPPVAGLGVSLLKRFRQIVWTGAGFAAWFVCRRENSKLSSEEILSFDTPLDRLIHRPPSRRLARLLLNTPATPNALTLASVLSALISGWCFSAGQPAAALAGLFFFYGWALLDHADGDLARMRGCVSRFGKALDDSCDIVSSIFISTGIFAGLVPFWNAHDRSVLTKVFIAALALNSVAECMAVTPRRQARREGCEDPERHGPMIRLQKRFDRIAGRDPFYGLVLCVVIAVVSGVWFWRFLAMTYLLIGLMVVTVVFLTAIFVGQRKSVYDKLKLVKNI